MKKQLGAALAAGLILGAGALMMPAAAQAHTGDMSVTAICNTSTGEYDFTVTLATSNTRLNGTTMWRVGTSSFQGTPSNNNNMDRGPVSSSGAQTITLGSFSLPGTTTGKGPWVYAFTTWTDGYKKGSDGQLLTNLAGDCSIPTPPVPEQPDPLSGTETRTGDIICVEPLQGTATITSEARDWTQAYVWDEASWSWVLGDKVPGKWVVTGVQTVNAETCIPSQPEPLSGNEERVLDPVCLTPLNGTASVVTEGRSWTQGSTWNQTAGQWELDEKVYTDWGMIDTSTVPNEECEPPVIPPVDTPKEPTPKPELPNTGGSDTSSLMLGGIGLLSLGALLIARRFALK